MVYEVAKWMGLPLEAMLSRTKIETTTSILAELELIYTKEDMQNKCVADHPRTSVDDRWL
jgi:hypothetical protein